MARRPRTRVYSWEFDELPETIEELEALYMKMARTADTRLRKLEKSSVKNAKSFAYAKAQESIKEAAESVGRPNAQQLTRFYNKNLLPTDDTFPTNRKRIAALKAMNRNVQRFLKSPTSREKGIIKHESDVQNTLREKYGIALTPTQMKTFFRSQFWKKIKAEGYDSGEVLVIVGLIQNDELTKSQLEKMISDKGGLMGLKRADFAKEWAKNKTKTGYSSSYYRANEDTYTLDEITYERLGADLLRTYDKLFATRDNAETVRRGKVEKLLYNKTDAEALIAVLKRL